MVMTLSFQLLPKIGTGTVITVDMPGDVPRDEDHSNAVPQSFHQRKRSKITTNLTDVQEYMMAE